MIYGSRPEWALPKGSWVSDNDEPHLGPRPCYVQPSGVVDESQITIHVAPDGGENNYITLSALESVNGAHADVHVLRDCLLE